MKKFFTSESVTEGHPDKICDQISDAILDAIIEKDRSAHVAAETVCNTGFLLVMGEISTSAYVDIPRIARSVVTRIGYNGQGGGFDGHTCAVFTSIDEQSADIAGAVHNALETRGLSNAEADQGAGDQGLMFGYACDETEELMPLPVSLAHRLAKKLTAVRKDGKLPYLLPDGKTQVTVEYADGVPARVDAVVVSSQHREEATLTQIREDILRDVIKTTIPANLLDENTKYFVNPSGRFVIGGPQGDSGLTGRKIVVDTYGGYARHGGGAFSGKDPSKVDRSAAYAARYVAKNIVAAGLAKKAEVQLAYAIGVAQPVSVLVDTFNTGKYADDKIAEAVAKTFDLRPAAIIELLGLRKPIYEKLAAYGHMGREELGVKWEQTDKTAELLKYLT